MLVLVNDHNGRRMGDSCGMQARLFSVY